MHIIRGFAAILVFSAALVAQSTYGTLLGSVTDATGAAVPRASILVTEVTTNTSKSRTVDERGGYEIPNLLPGNYEISVTAPGFKEFIRRGLVLERARRSAWTRRSKWARPKRRSK